MQISTELGLIQLWLCQWLGLEPGVMEKMAGAMARAMARVRTMPTAREMAMLELRPGQRLGLGLR